MPLSFIIPHVSMQPKIVVCTACGGDEISGSISMKSEGRSLTFEGRKRTDNLSRFGTESPIEAFPPNDDLHDSSSHLEASTVPSSASSASESEGSTDLNTLSSVDASAADAADSDSIIYELFPASSFLSFTGIKCHHVDESRLVLAWADRTTSCRPQTCTADELRKSEALVREQNGVKPNWYDFDDDSIIECIEEDRHEPVSAKG
jgi:hypothetical protein